MYTVDQNIPMPNPMRNGVTSPKYPFSYMSVGDSFAVPVDPATKIGWITVRNRICGAISSYKKRNSEVRFAMRKIASENVLRVWRIK